MDVFSGIVGHGSVTEMLTSEIDNPSHGYLFVGPSNVGKSTVARRFAAALLCGDDEACFARAVGGRHPDLVLVEPEGRASITVDQARQMVAQAVRTPLEANRKVFLLEEGGMMNDEAANTLLKTLEEPTDTTTFILVADSADDLPPTVASRSRIVLFSRVPEEEITGALVSRGVDQSQADHAAITSGGRPGIALLLATQPEVAAFRSAWLGVPTRLDPEPGTAFRLAGELVGAVDPLLRGLADRQDAETAATELGDVMARRLKERHDRERKRATSALHVAGLEILASWYRDAAAAQYGGSIRNRDVAGADLADVSARDAVQRARRVLATVDSLEANQRADLAFAALFSELANPD